MVFLTWRLLLRKKVMVANPEKAWKKELQKRLAWHLRGRVRNCYKLTRNAVNHSLKNSTTCRSLRRNSINKIFSYRIAAGCAPHGVQYSSFMKSLYESDILLNKKMLAQLSTYEPRTFQSLCELVKTKHTESVQKGLASALGSTPSGVITRDMIKKVKLS
ncbi:unnamed protein product [Candidula unifasciata]|uniref:Large ribosomal subunit protein bL20m n=1 Tax=Candidula unifasciata TaxID=100452 RepID=A0A8S3ZAD4_9EUPU|nr:unnamed protein product [Candidula unifasciata]